MGFWDIFTSKSPNESISETPYYVKENVGVEVAQPWNTDAQREYKTEVQPVLPPQDTWAIDQGINNSNSEENY